MFVFPFTYLLSVISTERGEKCSGCSRKSFSRLFFSFSLSLSQLRSSQHTYIQLRLSSLLSLVMYRSCFSLFLRFSDACTLLGTSRSYRHNPCWLLLVFSIARVNFGWGWEREKEREKRTSSGRGGCQEAVVRTRSEIETLPACARERVYMESSLRRTRTEIAPLAGRVARTRFRLLQYLSCCKFDVSLIIRGQKGDEGIEEATKEEERENEVAKSGRERREGEG